MKLTHEIRSQFKIFILMNDLDLATSAKQRLVEKGYDVFLMPDSDVVLDRIKKDPPHLIIFSNDTLLTPLENFVHQILRTNYEIAFLPVAPLSEMPALLKFQQLNFAGIVPLSEKASEHMSWMVDEAIRRLYLTYQNEQLIDRLDRATEQNKKLEDDLMDLKNRPKVTQTYDLEENLKPYSSARTIEELVNTFWKTLEDKHSELALKGVFFKFLPSVKSFLSLSGMGVPSDMLQGLGFQLGAQSLEEFVQELKAHQTPASLDLLMKEGFKVPQYLFWPVWVKGEVQAILVLWTNELSLFKETFANDQALFGLLFERFALLTKQQVIDRNDPVTSLAGLEAFRETLQSEVARARRLLRPVSVVKLRIDAYPHLEKLLGTAGRDQVVRTVVEMIQRTSRPYDRSFRTQENELALVLPHCGRKGAAIRGERLRRVVEAHSFSMVGAKITVSCGVSEYPTLCETSEELEATTQQAVNFIAEKGGNKVCLYKPVESFKPQFDVAPL